MIPHQINRYNRRAEQDQLRDTVNNSEESRPIYSLSESKQENVSIVVNSIKKKSKHFSKIIFEWGA